MFVLNGHSHRAKRAKGTAGFVVSRCRVWARTRACSGYSVLRRARLNSSRSSKAHRLLARDSRGSAALFQSELRGALTRGNRSIGRAKTQWVIWAPLQREGESFEIGLSPEENAAANAIQAKE
jgi:hypothetical protein